MRSRLAEINLEENSKTTEDREEMKIVLPDFLQDKPLNYSQQQGEPSYAFLDEKEFFFREKITLIAVAVSQSTAPVIVNTLDYQDILIGYQYPSNTSPKIKGYDEEYDLAKEYSEWSSKIESKYKNKIIAYCKLTENDKLTRDIILIAETEEEILEKFEKGIEAGEIDPETPLCFISLKEELNL